MPSEGTQVGQRVMVDPMKHPLPLEFLNRPLEIMSVDGEGAQALVWLKGPKGVVQIAGIPERFRPGEFLAALANLDPGELPRIVEREKKMQMSLADEVLNLTNDYKKKYNLKAAEAAKKAGADVLATDEKLDAYLGHPSPREPLRSPTETQVRAEIEAVAREYDCSAQQAAEIIICLAGAAKFEERVLALTASGLDASTALNRAQRENPADAVAYQQSKLL